MFQHIHKHASPKIIERNMQEGRIGLSTQQGFLDYSSMDISAYQRERLAAFVGDVVGIAEIGCWLTTLKTGMIISIV